MGANYNLLKHLINEQYKVGHSFYTTFTIFNENDNTESPLKRLIVLLLLMIKGMTSLDRKQKAKDHSSSLSIPKIECQIDNGRVII